MPSHPGSWDSLWQLKVRSTISSAAIPRLVAESLLAVPDPLVTALRPGPPASPAAVVASLAASLAPEEDAAIPPSWLYPQQIVSFRRAVAAVQRHGGALLADPVGTGKTYVALAVAAALGRKTTTVLVPAALRRQWDLTAAALGVPICLCSHEQASRGALPRTRGPVVIDESHRFRNPRTRRYRHTAVWLIGRPVLLVSATPVVNRISDLAHQLLLAVRDDALLLDGVVSLRALLASDAATPALGQLIIETEGLAAGRPGRSYRTSTPTPQENDSASRIIEALRRLRLSPEKPVATLVSGVLLRAAASSPAALHGSLGRYRRLLLHARDALAAGHTVDRAELRRLTGDLGDQLLLWELIPVGSPGLDLELGDLPLLDQLIGGLAGWDASGDPKLHRLRDHLADGAPSLIFTTYKDTVHYLRRELADLKPAWCTGERAGLGRTAAARNAVLSWFRAEARSAFSHLIVTDVAAEGLDLQRASRVIHYDLPWTPMRIEQREGRSVRYGSQHAQVEIVRFRLPATMERVLRLEGTLGRKECLPGRVGLGPDGRRLWRWRAELARRYSGEPAAAGVARVISGHTGLIAGFTLHDPVSGRKLSASIVWITPDGSWSESSDMIGERMTEAFNYKEAVAPDSRSLRTWSAHLAAPVRERLALRQGLRWIAPDPTVAARSLAARLQSLVHQAARQHQPARLAELERAIGLVTRGHTSGEGMLLEQLVQLPDRRLLAALRRLTGSISSPETMEVRLTGLIVFEMDPACVP